MEETRVSYPLKTYQEIGDELLENIESVIQLIADVSKPIVEAIADMMGSVFDFIAEVFGTKDPKKLKRKIRSAKKALARSMHNNQTVKRRKHGRQTKTRCKR